MIDALIYIVLTLAYGWGATNVIYKMFKGKYIFVR